MEGDDKKQERTREGERKRKKTRWKDGAFN